MEKRNLNIPPSTLGFMCRPDLPPHLNFFFKAKPPLEGPPNIEKKNCRRYGGVFEGESQKLKELLYSEKSNLEKNSENVNCKYLELAKKIKQNEEELKEKISNYNPKDNSDKKTKEPTKTIFVGRLDYKVDETVLEKHFNRFGKIVMVKLVRDLNGNSRGYAFIEYASSSSCKEAFYEMHKTEILGRKIVVEYEEGRCTLTFLPRKLGGKKGHYRDLPSNIQKELKKVYEKNPHLKPDNLYDFRYSINKKDIRKKENNNKLNDLHIKENKEEPKLVLKGKILKNKFEIDSGNDSNEEVGEVKLVK